MVESDGLENRCALRCTVGSNPTLSALQQPDLLQNNESEYTEARVSRASVFMKSH